MGEQSAETSSTTKKHHARVYIYGGGIAGLTAAHELALRGFEVRVYEREGGLGARGGLDAPALGGLARTQYFAIRSKERLYYKRVDRRMSTYPNPERDWNPFPLGAGPKANWNNSTDSLWNGRQDSLKDASSVIGPMTGQGARAHTYFPECWLEYTQPQKEGKEPGLTLQSQKLVKEFTDSVKTLLSQGYFNTKSGKLSDVSIRIQAFEDPSSGTLENTFQTLQPPGAARSDEKVSLLARKTRERLVELLQETELKDQVHIHDEATEGPLRAASSLGLAPVARNWVRVLVHRPQLPGEHGYRFFPSFYRHVFETMQRIPLYDASGQALGGSVLDNLIPLPHIGMFSKQNAPFILSWMPPQKGDVLSRLEYGLRNMRQLGITSQDLSQFALRVLRYMTTSSQRRAAELEGISWWDYLEGLEPRTGARLYRYSDTFKRLVQSSSRVLAALDGAHGDARSCGNTYVQLLSEALVPTARNNCTLNGPTSEAWFFHWRNHLESLGVRFFYGELRKLKLRKGRLVARVWSPDRPTLPPPPSLGAANAPPPQPPKGEEDGIVRLENDLQLHGVEEKLPVYFLVATDLLSAARVTKDLQFGVPARLQDYAYKVPERPGASRLIERDPERKAGQQEWDRLQTISGIQYFFEKQVSLFDGYIYCTDAEWGLSAICSHLVWQDRPIGKLSTYQSILSVDIGDWETPSKRLGLRARECTAKVLQEEVLHQVTESLKARAAGERAADFVMPRPDWVHIDTGLLFDRSHKRLVRNKTPYLVPIVGDWQHRPGPDPWDPTPQTPPPPGWSAPTPYVWQAPHGGYPVHHDRLLFAGTWLKTFTRLTTMESANESGRHAVNALLDHCCAHHLKKPRAAPPTPSAAPPGPGSEPFLSDPNERGLFSTTPLGDYCRIWNPERNELPDFELLQRQDEQNFLKGQAHPWELLGVEWLPSLLSGLPGAGLPLEKLLQRVGALALKKVPEATYSLLTVLRSLRMLLEKDRPPRGY
jgi:hypothetical protein